MGHSSCVFTGSEKYAFCQPGRSKGIRSRSGGPSGRGTERAADRGPPPPRSCQWPCSGDHTRPGDSLPDVPEERRDGSGGDQEDEDPHDDGDPRGQDRRPFGRLALTALLVLLPAAAGAGLVSARLRSLRHYPTAARSPTRALATEHTAAGRAAPEKPAGKHPAASMRAFRGLCRAGGRRRGDQRVTPAFCVVEVEGALCASPLRDVAIGNVSPPVLSARRSLVAAAY